MEWCPPVLALQRAGGENPVSIWTTCLKVEGSAWTKVVGQGLSGSDLVMGLGEGGGGGLLEPVAVEGLAMVVGERSGGGDGGLGSSRCIGNPALLGPNLISGKLFDEAIYGGESRSESGVFFFFCFYTLQVQHDHIDV